MLKSLTISNYALIENLEIEFPEGLVIITGETGAGKTILLGALSLLLGNRADPGVLKNSEKNCVVEACFGITKESNIVKLFKDEAIDFGEDITLRRVITPSGKSRNFVNDQPVSLQFLKDLSDRLVDIHAQHQQLLLADSNFQLLVLDSFALNKNLLENYKTEFEELIRLNKKHQELKEKISKEEAELDYNSFQYNQLKEANLCPGELEEIEGEFRLLSNAEEIKSSLYSMASLMNPSDLSMVQILKEMTSTASRISGNYPAAESISARIESCRIELKDIEEEILASAEKVTVSPERALLLEERISLIYNLLKKHSSESVEELILIQKSLEEKLKLTENRKDELEKLSEQIEAVTEKRGNLANELYNKRVAVAKDFESILLGRIKELEMPHAMFETRVELLNTYTSNGNSSVKFFFSANKNSEVRELSKVASGGELSRIMLCLKSVMARGSGMPTMIFDEIDTGVSGKIADKMGNLIGEMAKNMQIFAITHLPQIASKGDCHLLVYKELDKNNTSRTEIRRISGEERLIEIARMLSGAKLTEAAVANAKELLYN